VAAREEEAWTRAVFWSAYDTYDRASMHLSRLENRIHSHCRRRMETALDAIYDSCDRFLYGPGGRRGAPASAGAGGIGDGGSAGEGGLGLAWVRAGLRTGARLAWVRAGSGRDSASVGEGGLGDGSLASVGEGGLGAGLG
jgi:hypothetical protein